MNKLIYDIGASNIKFALMSPEGGILARNKVSTPHDSLENYLSALETLAAPYRGQADGAAFSTNGRMYTDGVTYRSYTMDFLKNVNLQAEMEKRLQVPVVVENDGYAAALGEWWKGAGQGARNMLCFVIGSGLGGGLILEGRPVYGSHNNGAMVFGQLSTSVPAKEEYVLSGLETAFSFVLIKAAMAKGMDPMSLTGPQFFEMAASGDPIACHLLHEYCKALAVTIYNSAVLLDLDAVVLTGGLSRQDSVIEGVQTALDRISETSLTFQGQDLRQFGVLLEPEDFHIHVTRGRLALDANLYGALYRLVAAEDHA